MRRDQHTQNRVKTGEIMTQQPLNPAFDATVLGYPRIGADRELKKALEAHWAGKISLDELHAAAGRVQLADLARLSALGLDAATGALPGDVAYYDQVLETTAALSAVPSRFAGVVGERIGTAEAFVLARGDEAHAPLELTKWFDTNYHYLVPEIGPATAFAAHPERLLANHAAHTAAGFASRPTLVGPLTYLLLAKAEDGAPAGFSPLERLDDAVAAYAALLAILGEAGVAWVQLDEPALVTEEGAALAADGSTVTRVYSQLAAVARAPRLLVTAGYGTAGDPARPGHVQGELARAGVAAVHADLVRGVAPVAAHLGELNGATLVAGVVNSRNIWRNDLAASLFTLRALQAEVAEAGGALAVGTATSLQHVPHTVAAETSLPEHLPAWLAFADEKVTEVITLARGLREGDGAIEAELAADAAAHAARAAFAGTSVATVRERLAALTPADLERASAEERRAAQAAALGLPPLPTTTIGSFPQTAEVRKARAGARNGSLSEAEYEAFLKAEIERVVRFQEELGLDVLVHGEAERNDMVQYFAENFDGYAPTTRGWVQSYGSRSTRPAILWGDVSRPRAFTVPWISYAASLTNKPLKGMLTGPVTILAWSFVRDDQPLEVSAQQVALALRDEIEDLQAAGIGIIQVDEPALRELLPLRAPAQADYLRWSVDSFRLATAGADTATQIHTHLCYSEFGEVVGAIDALDADVTSIEAARSRMEVTGDLAEFGFSRGIGPGVYDIHSPRVPSTEEIDELLAEALKRLTPEQLWVNPDCGLKTRAYPETEASLRHLVEAAAKARASIAAAV
jgi:5-methyltetrahydropteroyltriglutamate--homocysteine methyltransferase